LWIGEDCGLKRFLIKKIFDWKDCGFERLMI